MVDLFERERWLLGEEIGRDPRASWVDMAMLESRITHLILNGYGKWMAEQLKKEGAVIPKSLDDTQ